MKIMIAEVPYSGHVLTSNGLKPDPSKVHTVEKMPSPADKAALLRFLGTVNHMSKFIPNLACRPNSAAKTVTAQRGRRVLVRNYAQIAYPSLKKILTHDIGMNFFKLLCSLVLIPQTKLLGSFIMFAIVVKRI